jgi:hypothetical protein
LRRLPFSLQNSRRGEAIDFPDQDAGFLCGFPECLSGGCCLALAFQDLKAGFPRGACLGRVDIGGPVVEQSLCRLSGAGHIANLAGTAFMNLHSLVERLVLKRTHTLSVVREFETTGALI